MIKCITTYDLTCDRCKQKVNRLSTLYLQTPFIFHDYGYDRSHRENIAELCDECWDGLMTYLGKEKIWWRKLLHFIT